jgi:hypothetical protein
VAHTLEALAMVAERGQHEQQWSSPERARLRHARCCYGHLAGELADQLYLRMVAQGWVRRGAGKDVALTALGQRELAPLLR